MHHRRSRLRPGDAQALAAAQALREAAVALETRVQLHEAAAA